MDGGEPCVSVWWMVRARYVEVDAYVCFGCIGMVVHGCTQRHVVEKCICGWSMGRVVCRVVGRVRGQALELEW